MIPGYIRLHRRLREWRWYKVPAVRDTFIHLLLIANYTDGFLQDVEIKRGQAVFSYDSLSAETGFSVKQCRNAIQKLKSTGEISVWTNRHFSVATITKYEDYQADEGADKGQTEGRQRADKGQTKGRQRADKGQTKGRQRATSKKEEKEEEYKKKINKRKNSVYSLESASFDIEKIEKGDMFD